ncbi:uncharacterized protein LOC128242797 [Mya arenaria]|uniref:uncharacterized protein LOC128242797 n=1 Tax=Mya arenaria TaxID=6604 RepID=UPI0022E03B22|nr:uncharacterized protein LOC128242797 [Mya arenaria]
MEEEVVLEQVMVDSHGQILAKVVKEAEQDGDGVFKDYEEMLLQLNSLLDNRQMASSLPYHPTENELCAGKVESIWFRVEVKNVLSRKSGPHGTCYRVDEGDTLTIPVAHLRHLPAKFQQLPYQVHPIVLHGIQPFSLVISEEDLMVYPGVRPHWDEAAVKYIHDNIKAAKEVRCKVVNEGSGGALYVLMYLKTRSGPWVFLNETLKNLEYATDFSEDVEVPIVKTKEDLIRERFRKQREDRRLREDLSSRSDHEFACHPGRPTGRFSPVDRGYRTDGQYNDLVARKTSPISTDEMLANEKRQKERVVYVQEERLREVPSGFAIKHESKGDPQGPIGVKLGSHVQHVSEGSYDKEAMRLMSRPRAMMQRLEREQSDLDDHNMNSKGYDAGKVEGPSRSFSGDYSTTEEAMTSRKSVEGASLHAGLFRGRGSVGSLSDTSGEGGVQRLGRGLMSPQFRGLPDSGAQSDIEGLLRGRGAKSPLTSVSDDGNNSTRSRKSLSPLTKVMNSQLTVGSGLSSLLTSGIGRANSPGRGRSSGRESDGANSSALSADEGGYRLPLHGRGVDPKLPQSPKGVLLYRSQNLQSLTNYDSQSENEKFENALDAEGKSDTHIAISLPKSKQIPSDVFNQYQHLSIRSAIHSEMVINPQTLKTDSNLNALNSLRAQSQVDSYGSDTKLNTSHQMKTISREESYGRGEVLSGSESSTSIVSAQMMGQAGFRKARIPKETSVKPRGIVHRSISRPSDSDDSDRQLNISQTSSILSEPQNPGQVAMSTRVKFRGVETSPVSRGNRPLATQHSGQGDCSETINSDVEQRKVAVSQQLPNTLNSRLPLTIPPETISADAGLKEKTKLVDLKKLLPPQLNKSKATDVKSESVLKDANLKHGSPVTTNVEGNNSAAPVSRKQAREEAKGKTARDFVDISPPFANKVDRRTDSTKTVADAVLGKMQGQRILERLTQGAGVSKKQAMQGDGAESVKFQSTDRVLVHGGSLRHPWFSIQDTRFAPTITKSFEDQDFRSPQLVQSYSWPIIVRGRHLVALSPPSTGKTLAYLFPLLSALTVTSHYDEIRKNGSGAFVVILTWTWERAQVVYDTFTQLQGSNRSLRALLIHGGGLEETKTYELINGCDVLVATPPSMQRILQNGYTDLRRLCHLVVDDADVVLEKFIPEMNYIIKEYDLLINNEMKHYECPRQILVFGSMWNQGVDKFMATMNEPMLVITSHLEASIYGGVRQVPHMCRHNNRLDTVLCIVQNLPSYNSSSSSSRARLKNGKEVRAKTIIFCSQKSDVGLLHQTLRQYSIYCMMVHSDMDLYQALDVAKETELPLLVCDDKYVSEMRIRDATVIIHFDIPRSKTEFSNRMGCLRQYFRDFSKPENEQPPIQAISHLIITEESWRQAKPVHDLLVRSGTKQTPELQKFMGGIEQRHEEDESRDLCDQQLAFGVCRDVWRCRYRHSVMPDVDVHPSTDWLPNEGEIKVLVTHVIDASHYFVRVLGVRRLEGGKMEDLSADFSELQMNLALWYSDQAHQKRHSGARIGEICGYQENEMFFRVQVLQLKEQGSHEKGAATTDAVIMLIDSGRLEQIPVFKLYKLPGDLRAVAFQAVEVFLGRVKPKDKDIKWTVKASVFVHTELHGREMEGKIVLRLGHRLWLDPLVMRLKLGETRTIINKFSVHTELIRNGLADENPSHLERLFKMIQGKVHIPRALMIKTKMSQELLTDVLPACRPSHKVVISSVHTPDHLYIQRHEKLEELESLMVEIGAYVERQEEDDVLQEPQVGKYCLAQYASFDERWYRGHIQTVKDDTVEIFFPDYGDLDFVPRDKVREFPVDKFFELPLQAIECKLANIEKIGDTWEIRAGDALWDMSHFVNEKDLRPLVATVVQAKEETKYAGRQKFVVELRTTQRDLGQELVWRQLAKHTPDCTKYTPLLPRSTPGKRVFPSRLHKIPGLCSAVYWEKDLCKATKLAEELYNILSECLGSLSTTQESVAKEGLVSLVKMVGRVTQPEIHKTIFECLLCYVKAGDRMCDILLEENIVQLSTYCLEMNSCSIYQRQAADFITQAANISVRLQEAFRGQDSTDVLFELMESTMCQQVQGAVCQAFASLTSGSDGLFKYLMYPGHGLVQKIVSFLSKATDHSVSEGVLSLIAALSQHDSGHDDFKKESLMEAIVKNLQKTDCPKCIAFCVQQCDHFASTRRKHKTFLIEHHMITILNRILDLEMPPATKQLCKDLKTSLDFKVPSEPIRGLLLKPGMQHMGPMSDSLVAPEVRWNQNSFVMLLVIKVCDVNPAAHDLVTFTEDTISFRALSRGVNYGFTYRLYDRVCVEKCTWHVKQREVLVSLKKQEKGMWSRPLHDKIKHGNVVADCEHILDSSDSEEKDDQRPFLLSKGKKKKAMFRGMKQSTVQVREPEDTETDTSDSLENMDDFDNRTDYDFNSIAYQNPI